ncbi:MAG: hypothetical protein JNM62_01265 [Flavobacteriales bacterium]|nr:hypothetical protein [Flavobacteriales bacterium]
MKRAKFIFVSWTAFLLLVTLVLCYRYNAQEEIGVNQGIMSLWFMLFDSPLYLLAFLAPSAALWWLTRKRIGLSALVAMVQLLLVFDLHRWRYPSSVSEQTLSVFWSKL